MRSDLLACLALALSLAACEPPSAPTTIASKMDSATIAKSPISPIVEKIRQPTMAATEMQWETNGGGQVTFHIRRIGQSFEVDLTSYGLADRHDRFMIRPGSGAIYTAISAVMEDQRRISLHAPDEPPRGTWTTLWFADDQREGLYEDVVVQGDLDLIYDYVIAQIGR